MSSIRCKIGLHRYRSAGFKLERKPHAPCELRVFYTKDNFPIPIDRCELCKKERVSYCFVVRSAEVSNPFVTSPIYDCTCGKGNKVHRQEWKDRTDAILNKLRKRIVEG